MSVSEAPRIALADATHEAVAIALAQAASVDVDIPAELRRACARLWLAWLPSQTEPAGFLLAWVVADELHIIDLATRPALRRRGVARALLRHAIDYAKQNALYLALLEVRSSNMPAIALYLRHGFAETNVRPRYYADGEDALEMALELPTFAQATPNHPEG